MMRPLMTHGARRWRTLGLLPAIVASLVIPRVVTAETVTLAPTQDAWIDQVNQNTSHGADTELNVKARSPQKRRALVQFDLSSIPACANISSATLTLHVDSNSLATSLQHDVDRLTEAWTEAGVTWASRDGTNAWTAAGGTIASPATATALTGTGAGPVSWDVTSDVASFVSGAETNNGWAVKAKAEVNLDNNTNNTIIQYASRENATEANRPELEVTYTLEDANCDDGIFCNGAETCDPVAGCQPGTPPTCSDGIGCTTDICNPESDSCDHTPVDAACDDGNVCTIDSCDPGTGCVYTPGNAGVVCRPPAGPCDAEDTCTGSSAACPADAKSTAVCRPAAGICDVVESCDGVNNDCPADAKSTAACRPVTGDCDVAESCDGVSNDCPGDGFKDSSVVCRTSAGVCDPAENCTGNGPTCPADAKSTAVCRPTAGDCDVAESCDGLSNDCPANAFQPNTVVCRAAAGDCDVDDTCSGSSADCTDAKKADGTQCDDGNPDTISDTCENGVCGGIGIEELCPTQPISEDNCHQSPRNNILIKAGATNARNQLKWQWKLGDATDASDFGDPAASTYTTICAYDSTGLVLSATVPPVGLCPKGRKTQPCWTSLKKGTAWKYVDTSGAHDGVTVVRLTSGANGKAKLFWKMKGANIAMPGLPLDQSQQPVTVQVENIQNGDHKCWSAQYYGPPVRGRANIFLDKNP